MQKITPFLWFDDQAEEAAHFYVSVFRRSKIGTISRAGEEGPDGKKKALVVTFELEEQTFMALNGGPRYHFTPALSLLVHTDSQEEIDDLWEKLSAGGRKDRCGWLQDRYGLSWQIVPRALGEMMSDPDPRKSKRVMGALLGMDRIVIEDLRRAYLSDEDDTGPVVRM
ncbi:MAG TPA: VOC family protein [Thermoanaerobaculia bacterium]|nr:VOC family protein [Thermoanaerobaculia bacterium]